MPEVQADPALVGACGLYCGACGAQRKGRCAGCSGNSRATWCPVRACCGDKQISTCADCTEFADPNECRHYNSFFARACARLFNSDRAACIQQIRALGLTEHAAVMAQQHRQSLPRR